MEEISINILVDAKNEYTKQLTNILVPYIYEGVESIYQDSLNLDSKNVLKQFQNLLQKVPKWNQEMIDIETKRIIDASKCNYLGDLLTAVFVANAKILTAVATIHKGKKIQLRVPQISEFIHKCYIESAREFYKNPYLFDKSCRSIEKHRNLRESLGNINNAIVEAVRKLLPMQEILQQYLGDSFGMHEEDDISVAPPPPKDKMTFNKKFMKYEDEDDDTSVTPPLPLPQEVVVQKPLMTPPSQEVIKEVVEQKPSMMTLPQEVVITQKSSTTPPPQEVVTTQKPSTTPPLQEEVAQKPTMPLPQEVVEPKPVVEVITKVETPAPVKVIDTEDKENGTDEEVEDEEEMDMELERLEKEIEAEVETDVKHVDLMQPTSLDHARQNRTRRIIRRKKHKEYEDATKKLNKEIGFYNDADEASGESEENA